ncbi:acetyl/propionyl/methylcrotonyl-CoA carboxylase subunit alpha [Idiomarina xiamenensis]|uniref:Biotin carboxylase n=1 Tax=Idiomarina xiamenensis 10-D-4 TaxID=740709 RepID=K2KAM2_9GAMM|nr:acetyl/propionyl/methylcrotonyl-CoA carboxylase subunit alpha [Idiomarina xiamenensis]EKE84888.1 3-methylcrotonyl-CoA carboxylase subunit alpha [Idiomarina xiamenensis 10-D-4]
MHVNTTSAKTITKLLIANRGEIACRVISTAQRMGIATVAIYSDADQHARHVQLADEAVHVGAAASSDSYLQIERIIAAAKQTGAQAIHPGYGFLSENEAFADACASNHIIFVGPPVNAIAAMGSKSAAKAIMDEAGVPLVPGYHGSEQDADTLAAAADKIGYPVLLKAAYGGGGKGMRLVEQASEFNDALASAKREAKASFGNERMLIEKFIRNPRHVEVQVFADEHGNAVYLAERDCSVQRRHQKILEEAPAPALAEKTRVAMGEAAVRAAQAIDYVGAGTVEFLFDANNQFYFMEMNTRLQVEHPVTEMITGLDLVEWQLRVAAGETLPLAQDDIQLNGHAFEARIYAEDPDNDFLPCTGRLNHLRAPLTSAHVRIDTGVVEGDEVTAFYDPMIAKLVVWDVDRSSALRRLQQALSQYRITGLSTNISFLQRICAHPQFQRAELTTQFIDKHATQLFQQTDIDVNRYAIIASLFDIYQRQQQSQVAAWYSPWDNADSFRLNQGFSHQLQWQYGEQTLTIQLTQQGQQFSLANDAQQQWQVLDFDGDYLSISENGHRFRVAVADDGAEVTLFNQLERVSVSRYRVADTLNSEADAGGLQAPMNGTVVEVLVQVDDWVEKDQALLIMEAMKMEYTIRAPAAGRVSEVFYQPGELVSDGAELLGLAQDTDNA